MIEFLLLIIGANPEKLCLCIDGLHCSIESNILQNGIRDFKSLDPHHLARVQDCINRSMF